ncbi:acetyl-CoA C-acetyltransferase [Rhizorhapis sp. SPR117]|uniref:acetyl-CoA C-acetyltransferase n=1 Tax=Rhizorhapis sp. SPR117 TaxID=2912611 RepID=UPI001F02D2ED|nr:acetyl-CoA C-acetyltransferase [Rhizorhapis sp. SPR117]
MTDCYIYDAVRTPRGRGRKDGALFMTTPVELAATTLRALRDRNKLDTGLINDVVMGCVEPVSDQGSNIGRIAALASGYSETVPGLQLNRFCGSGLEATNVGAAKIMSGQADMVVVGGVESMSRVPMGSSGGAFFADPTVARILNYVPQGISADAIATLNGYDRTSVDSFAVESQQRAGRAWKEGRFNGSIIPVKNELGEIVLDRDEHIRPETTVETLAKLKASFETAGEKDGFDSVIQMRYPEIERVNHVHHAGNSSGIVDGSAAILLGTLESGQRAGLKPRARIRAFGSLGSEPSIMLTGPVASSEAVLARAGMTAKDIDLFEINEAFAAVVMFFRDKMNIDPDCLNVNGGAIAMGHALGATGAMLVGIVLDELERCDLTNGLITLCVGAGMGTTTIIERV